jgi:hypothetical protein
MDKKMLGSLRSDLHIDQVQQNVSVVNILRQYGDDCLSEI